MVSLVGILESVSADSVEPDLRLGRYRTISVAAAEQMAVMSAPVTVEFPEGVQTVGQAVEFVLKGSGFQIASDDAGASVRVALTDLPLPAAHRSLGPVTLQQLLKVLGGPGFQLVIDPVHRLISFELSLLGRAVTDPVKQDARSQRNAAPVASSECDVDTRPGQRR